MAPVRHVNQGRRQMSSRGSGILMHVTSLPSAYGIGDLGPAAYRFADFLAESGQRFWQVLPMSPTSLIQGSSPYSSVSAFACNPLLISPESLKERGLLSDSDIEPLPDLQQAGIDYGAVTAFKTRLHDAAYRRFRAIQDRGEYEGFCSQNSHWLGDFALFAALKTHFEGKTWNEWPDEFRDRNPEALDEMRFKLRDEMEKEQFIQFVLYRQWFGLKRYCNDKGIQIIGDIPIYVSLDSSDVWGDREIFKLDDAGKPTFVAGVPPDYFSVTGQLWGNPVYNWDQCRQNGFRWWLRRMEHTLSLFDIVRVDHIRGLVAYWEIPAKEKTAINGCWVEVPWRDFFDAMVNRFPELPIIAEDLGLITPDVKEMMKRYGFPGMKVLLFAFNDDNTDHPYRPHTYESNCVVYTGTHDNNTVRGWLEGEAREEDKRRLFAYVGRDVNAEEISWELIDLAMKSHADMAVFPMQDILGLGEDARMNTPADGEGNWGWRLLPDQIDPDVTSRLLAATQASGRV
ncbi:MAG: 4-alpha-glucanotransferase [Candidatus Eisenbacteria bacterium]